MSATVSEFVDDSKSFYTPTEVYRGTLNFAEIRSDSESARPTPFIICTRDTNEEITADHFRLRLVGDDGRHCYSATVTSDESTESNQSALSLRRSKTKINDLEWRQLILFLFTRQNHFEDDQMADSYRYPKVYFNASRHKEDGEDYYKISIVHQLDGFTTVLGRLVMFRDDKKEELVDMNRLCAQSIRDNHKQDFLLVKAGTDLEQAKKMITELKAQLSEFIEKKKESEDLLLAKFKILLNEKKRRIAELAAEPELDQMWETMASNQSEPATPEPERPRKRTRKTRGAAGAEEVREPSRKTRGGTRRKTRKRVQSESGSEEEPEQIVTRSSKRIATLFDRKSPDSETTPRASQRHRDVESSPPLTPSEKAKDARGGSAADNGDTASWSESDLVTDKDSE
ncbi:hypothetical protein BZA70DRAFT_163310 [Myxozyma melibiosi]|uniref:Uncharacterized protein n=1 Tax=Myxozyma melibiosi TaxID=54550 RepID=A0ABR1F6U5_9ASCO